MSKPYQQMTPAERLSDRIAKNKAIDEKLARNPANWTLPVILTLLNKHRQRASYGAVAKLVGVLPRGLMTGRSKCSENSWIVASSGPQQGWPTGYEPAQIHPDCLRQLREQTGQVIDNVAELRNWLRSVAPSDV